jgi:hypothetical protein
MALMEIAATIKNRNSKERWDVDMNDPLPRNAARLPIASVPH